MSKKLFTDSVFTSATAALNELQSRIATATEYFPSTDPLAILSTNIPDTYAADAEGNAITVPALGLDDNGTIVLTDPAAAGTLALITLYSTNTQPQAEGEALAIPAAIYLINLPSHSELATAPALHEYRAALFNRAMLSAARKLAKLHHENAKTDEQGNVTHARPMPADRLAALISTVARGANADLAAFKIMFPVLQQVMLTQATKAAEALKSRGRAGDAKLVLATFSKARLSAETLKACLSSRVAAENHFASMKQEQWAHLLDYAIRLAPACPVRVMLRDDANKPVKDAEGKTRYETRKTALSSTIFQTWKDTRDSITLATADAEGLSFDGLTA
jgi:hypothetical protein